MNRKQVIAIILSVLVVFSVGAVVLVSFDSKVDRVSDQGACKNALREQFHRAMVYNEEGTRPSECEGLTDEQVQQLAHEVLDEEMAR